MTRFLEDRGKRIQMRKLLVVIDMQKDFVDGALGTKEAEAIVPAVLDKMDAYAQEDIYATRDTHGTDYLQNQEGQFLPVEHCIAGTAGWQLLPEIEEKLLPDHIYDKPTFGSVELAAHLKEISEEEEIEIELCGLCTDICVVSNALLFKANMPEIPISLDVRCCAGVTPEQHHEAIETMRSCQVIIRGE